jgi:hypothetical protein
MRRCIYEVCCLRSIKLGSIVHRKTPRYVWLLSAWRAASVLVQEQEPALVAAVDFSKETWAVLVINAIAIPAIAYWLLANALHLERVSRGMLATALELAALGVVVWRCRNTRGKPEQ